MRQNYKYAVDGLIKQYINNQYGVNMVDSKKHFVHRKRLTVIIDRRKGVNMQWFVFPSITFVVVMIEMLETYI